MAKLQIKEVYTNTVSAISAINPDAQVIVYGEDYNTIDWGDTAVISKADIDAKKVELDAEWNAQAYARARQNEYPDWGSQLNKIYDDGLAKWKSEMVDPIKAKYPKP